MKHCFYQHYWWIVSLVAVVAVSLLLLTDRDPELRFTLTAVGALISIVFFVQKQKLEELKMFKDLFREFNERYDDMNEKLNKIVEVNSSDELAV